MKHFIFCLIFALASALAIAQTNVIPGMRSDITEVSVNDEEYSLFMYRDEGGPVGYYLSLGHVIRELGVQTPAISFSLDHVDEICLYLGNTTQDVYTMFDNLFALLDEEAGTFIDFPARTASWGERLGDPTTATCMVRKPLIGKKHLVFLFDGRHYTAQTYLSRPSGTGKTFSSLIHSFLISRFLAPARKHLRSSEASIVFTLMLIYLFPLHQSITRRPSTRISTFSTFMPVNCSSLYFNASTRFSVIVGMLTP